MGIVNVIKTQEDHIDDIGDSNGNPVAKARPKQAPSPTFIFSNGHVTISPLREWIDVEPGPYDKSCFEVSKKMIRLAPTRSVSTS